MVAEPVNAEDLGELNEPTLQALIARQLELQGIGREYNRVRMQVKRALDAMGLEVDRQYRIAGRVIVPRATSGGGFTVAAWTAKRYTFPDDEAAG